MSLLYRNDRRGAYPNSWYAATAKALPPFPALREPITADVCVIGAGYTGLSAALHLAEAGMRVVLLDAQRVGFGASGRNGGQLASGQRQDQWELEALVGQDHARALWMLGLEANALVRTLVARHGIDCHLRDGLVWTARRQRSVDDLHRYAAHMARVYDHEMVPLDRASLADYCPSPDYAGGVLDRVAGHVHPLALAFGLAHAAQAAGAQIFEQTEVTGYTEGPRGVEVATSAGSVAADQVILACNGYLGGLSQSVARRVMPINNYIVATEPLGARLETILPQDVAVADDRFVINYFRRSHDGRLLFGGTESYGYRFPADIAGAVRKPMTKVFPTLKGVGIDYAWGGTLAITMHRTPYLARLSPRVLNASGYSGQGVGTAIQAGKLMADAVRGAAEGFDTYAAIPSTPFPGGPRMRSPLLVLAMTWYALRDRLGF